MLTTTLRRIVVVPDNVSDENCTFFQRYSNEIASDYQWVFNALSIVPHDILEPFIDSSAYVKSKMAGSSLDVYMIRSNLLQNSHIDFDREFNVLWSSQETFLKTQASESLFRHKPIHITSFETNEAEFIGNLTPDSLNEKINEFILRTLAELEKNKIANDILSVVSSKKIKESLKFEFEPLNHNCTRPLYKTLTGYGYYAEKFEGIKLSENIEQHVNGMINMSKLIDDIRSGLTIPHHMVKNDAIIYCMSMCSEVVSGYLKMSYSTDVLRYMAQELKILTDEQYMDVHNQANHIINSNVPEWTNKFLTLLSDKTDKDETEIIELISDNFQFVETMLYSQLGRPENILISK